MIYREPLHVYASLAARPLTSPRFAHDHSRHCYDAPRQLAILETYAMIVTKVPTYKEVPGPRLPPHSLNLCV
jgi:hypothetical protein